MSGPLYSNLDAVGLRVRMKGKMFELVNGTVFNYFCVPQTFSLDSGLTSFCQLSIQTPVQSHQCYEACSECVTWLDVILSLGGLQSTGSQRIGRDWACTHSLGASERNFMQNRYHFYEFLKSAKCTVLVKDIHVTKWVGMREKATWIGKGQLE